MTDSETRVLRLIDANANRAREGLRVVEEIGRMLWDDTDLTSLCKSMRHEVTQLVINLPIKENELLAARESEGDVGKQTVLDSEKKRTDVSALLVSNIKRAQESFRVLEEFTKLLDAGTADRFKALRFKMYTLEKEVLLNRDNNGK